MKCLSLTIRKDESSPSSEDCVPTKSKVSVSRFCVFIPDAVELSLDICKTFLEEAFILPGSEGLVLESIFAQSH